MSNVVTKSVPDALRNGEIGAKKRLKTCVVLYAGAHALTATTGHFTDSPTRTNLRSYPPSFIFRRGAVPVKEGMINLLVGSC